MHWQCMHSACIEYIGAYAIDKHACYAWQHWYIPLHGRVSEPFRAPFFPTPDIDRVAFIYFNSDQFFLFLVPTVLLLSFHSI
jgi:hypothetical protein